MNISAEVQRDIDLKVDALLQDMYRREEKLAIDSRMVPLEAEKITWVPSGTRLPPDVKSVALIVIVLRWSATLTEVCGVS